MIPRGMSVSENKDMSVLLIQMAQDIGYIKGVLEPLAEAKVVDRLVQLEASDKAHTEEIKDIKTRSQRRLMALIAAIAGVGAISSSMITIMVYFGG